MSIPVAFSPIHKNVFAGLKDEQKKAVKYWFIFFRNEGVLMKKITGNWQTSKILNQKVYSSAVKTAWDE